MKRNPTLRSRVLERDGFKCAECGKDCSRPRKTGWPSTRKNSAAVDHRIPLWVGGKDTMKNARVLCTDCHKKKRA